MEDFMEELEEIAELEKLNRRIYVKTTSVPTKPGCWDYLLVEIFMDHLKVGEYTRNYHQMYNTFVPFIQLGKEYALYSKNYTASRIMTLPDCKDICGEEPKANGFCPVDFFVPYEPEVGINGQFGFVAGCVWGDDQSWKLQVLDLRKIEEGIIIRDDRLGYVELPDNIPLRDAVSLDDYYIFKDGDKEYDSRNVTIAVRKRFELDT